MTSDNILEDMETYLSGCYHNVIRIYDAMEHGMGQEKAHSAITNLIKAIGEIEAALNKPMSDLRMPQYTCGRSSVATTVDHDYDINHIASVYRRYWDKFERSYRLLKSADPQDDRADGTHDYFGQAIDDLEDAQGLAESHIDHSDIVAAEHRGY